MKVGINGAVRDISDLKVGVSGAIRSVSEAYVGVNGAVKKVWPTFPIGTQVIFDTVGSGDWECPASGNWKIELHGGGGGGSPGQSGMATYGAGGGGSGAEGIFYLTSGTVYNYTVGKRGARNGNGGTTIFGEHSVSGGGCGPTYVYESAQIGVPSVGLNNIASTNNSAMGGYGNINNTSQIYGNGGMAGSAFYPSTNEPGENGAIILTYTG